MANESRNYPDKIVILGGRINVTGSDTISVLPIACKDSTGDYALQTDQAITVDISTNGLNGLDIGTKANSTTYYLYIIKSKAFINDLAVGFVLSLSAVTPGFPSATNIEKYDLFRQVGILQTSATGNVTVINPDKPIKGFADTFADLPATPDNVLDIWGVRIATGIWLINRKPAGLYRWDIGSSSWKHMSAFPEQHNSANFEIFDDTDNTKRLIFDISNLSTATIRDIIMPDNNVDLSLIISSDISLSSVTGTMWTEKLSKTFTPLRAGQNYLVIVTFIEICSDTGVGTEVRIQLDNTVTDGQWKQVTAEKVFSTGYFQASYTCGMFTSLSKVAHTIDFDFRNDTAAKTSYMKFVTMRIQAI